MATVPGPSMMFSGKTFRELSEREHRGHVVGGTKGDSPQQREEAALSRAAALG